MLKQGDARLIERGISISDAKMYDEDKIWSRYSNDKVDIGEELGNVIRTIIKTLPIHTEMKALSFGSSSEPQFRILETSFRGGLFLLDVEKEALDIIRERIKRQYTHHVYTIHANYTRIFLNQRRREMFLRTKLKGSKMNLVTLHHSLYYSAEKTWHELFNNLFHNVLARTSAIHAVLMASQSGHDNTTTWLYNHFAGKYCGIHNNQDLRLFKTELQNKMPFKRTQIRLKNKRIKFYVDDFEKFMAVIWMILLYPNVHRYSLKQREEITEFVYTHLWKRGRPLLQEQDHLIIYRGINSKGL